MDDRERVLSELRAIADQRIGNEEAEREKVLEGRRLGIPWEDMAQALQRARSGLWQKYHDDEDYRS